MFKVRHISTGEVFTVYAVNPGGHFLIYAQLYIDEPRTWYWGNMNEFEPVEE